jgi:hypothetical protein
LKAILSDTDTTDGETVKGKGKAPEVDGDEDDDVIDVDDLLDIQVSVCCSYIQHY